MASRSDIEAGRAHILLYMKNTVPKALNDLSGSLRGVSSQVMKIATPLLAIGTAITAPLVAAIAHFAKAGSELNDMAARTGIAISSLVELKFAAEQTGAGIEAVETAVRKMQQTLVNAAAGGAEARKAIEDLHLSLKDLAGMPPDVQFQKIAERIAAIEDPGKRAAAAIAIFGKQGTVLLPMIQQLRALREEAKALGLAPSERAVQLADELGDAWDRVLAVAKATVFEIGAALAPTIMPILDATKNILLTIKKWAEQNSALVKSVFVLGVTIGAVGLALKFIADTFVGLSLIIGGTASVAALLLNPIVLIGAAIVGGVVAWMKFTESGKAAAAAIRDGFIPVLDTINRSIEGIGLALAGGDLELAGKIAITGLQLVFEKGLLAIADSFHSVLGDALTSIASDILAGDFAAAWQTAVAGMGAIWESGVQNMESAYNSFAASILETMAAVVGVIEDLWNGLVSRIEGALAAIEAVIPAILDRVPPPIGTDRSQIDAAKGLLSGVVGGLRGGASSVGASGTAALAGIRSGLDASGSAARIASAASGQGTPALDDFRARVEDRNAASRNRAEDLESELDRLRKDAALAASRAGSSVSGGGPAADVVAASTKAAGTFSAAALLALGQGGGSPTERTAKATEKAAAKLEQLTKINEDMLKEAKAASLAVIV